MAWQEKYSPNYQVINIEVTPPGGGKPVVWATTATGSKLEQSILEKKADGSGVRVSFWDNCYGEPVWLETLPDGKTVLLPV